MKVDNVGIDSATDGMEMLKPCSKITRGIQGNHVVQNPNTVAKRTRQYFISCADTAPELLAIGLEEKGRQHYCVVV